MAKATYILVYDRPNDGKKTVKRKDIDFEAFVAKHSEHMPLIDEDFDEFAKLIDHDDLGGNTGDHEAYEFIEVGDLTLGQVLTILNTKGWVWILGEESDITIIKA